MALPRDRANEPHESRHAAGIPLSASCCEVVRKPPQKTTARVDPGHRKETEDRSLLRRRLLPGDEDEVVAVDVLDGGERRERRVPAVRARGRGDHDVERGM